MGVKKDEEAAGKGPVVTETVDKDGNQRQSIREVVRTELSDVSVGKLGLIMVTANAITDAGRWGLGKVFNVVRNITGGNNADQANMSGGGGVNTGNWRSRGR